MAAIFDQGRDRQDCVKTILIICVGNPSRGDDAIGPLIAEKLSSQTQAPLGFDVIETFQLQPELVEDMHDRQLVLVVDAQANTNKTYTLRTVSPAPEFGWCSHAVSPEQLLTLFQTVYGHPTFTLMTLGIRAEQFELGSPLSNNVSVSINRATEAILKFISEMSRLSISSEDVLAVLQSQLTSEGHPLHA